MKKKLLVIDDNDEYRGLIPQYFSGKGYIVDAACGGREGVEKARKAIAETFCQKPRTWPRFIKK